LKNTFVQKRHEKNVDEMDTRHGMLKSASGDSQIAIFGKGRINSPWVAKNFRMNGRCNCPTFL